jgi:hypothetical protein
MSKNYLKWPLFCFDILIALLALVVIFILLTGGKTFYISTQRIRLFGIENPLTFLYLFSLIRFFFDRRTPFLGLVSINGESVAGSCMKLCKTLYLRIYSLRPSTELRIVIFIIGISLVIKVFNSYHFYGFFSGDDVEIHEMTFSHLFDWGIKAWNLRSPFYPMVFIYPLQAALLHLGVQDPFCLIFAGRQIVVLFSIINLYLVYRIAIQMFNSRPVGLLSLFFFALSKLQTTMGSTELPRTIASTFVLICFWILLLDLKNNQRLLIPAAGMVLAIGASIRFSEMIFVAAALLYLISLKRIKHAILFFVFFLTTFTLINLISDQLYWGQSFYSLKNIIDFTIVKGQSTRGFQPFFYYILGIGLWSNYFSFSLMLYSFRQNLQKVWIWVLTPIVLLSLLPHKEPRYLLPVIPFFCIMVGLSTWSLLGSIYHGHSKPIIQKKIPKPIFALLIILFALVIQAHKDLRFSYLVFLFLGCIALVYYFPKWKAKKKGVAVLERTVDSSTIAALLILLLLGTILFEFSDFQFHRSESGVEMARFLYHQPNNTGVAVDDLWRAGGRLYLYRKHVIINIDEASIRDKEKLLSHLKENKVDWIGIRDKNVKQYGYDTFLHGFGYLEIEFSDKLRLETYRLFRKENSRLNE